MKKDIQNRDDIAKLVNRFYERVKKDELINIFFTEVIKVDWERHLPVMYDFWENVLFHTGQYNGNPMIQHQQLHKRYPIHRQHFERWLQLFTDTTDELFKGDNAERIKQRATSIATIMQIKLLES